MSPAALPLTGLRVGISGAVPEREHWGNVRDLDRLILSFVSQLSMLVIKYGGQVVHASQPLLAPVVAEAARRRGDRENTSLLLVGSRLWGERPEVTFRAARIAHAKVLLTPKVGAGDPGDPDTRNDSLTAMRIVVSREIDVLIAVGGNLYSKRGFNPRVLEELTQARWHEVPCFVVGGLAGVAGGLEREVIEAFSAGTLMDSARNPLAAWSENMDEHVGQILLHLAEHRETFLKPQNASFSGIGQKTRLHEPILFDDEQAREVGALPETGAAKVVNVDPGLIRASTRRFAEFRSILDKGDLRGIREYLQPRVV
jgi:hypothetical protein